MARGAMVSMWSSDAPVAARPQLARMASVERVSSSSCSSGSRSSLTDRCSAEREQRERLLKADFAWESAAAERDRRLAGVGAAVASMSGDRSRLSALLGDGLGAAGAEAAHGGTQAAVGR